jgi:hypothetical protein
MFVTCRISLNDSTLRTESVANVDNDHVDGARLRL